MLYFVSGLSCESMIGARNYYRDIQLRDTKTVVLNKE